MAFTVEQFDQALKDGQYAWPGGYQRYFVMQDGEALSFKAAEQEAEQIRRSLAEPTIRNSEFDQWRVEGVDVNWEDPALFCCHSNERIPSAYAEEQS